MAMEMEGQKLDQQLPWVEKYRPKSVDDVCHQTEVVDTLRKSIETKDLPHLILYGPPGTGKTSTILAAGRELFGADYRKRVMELNASDERGINVVRTKIKTFAQVAVTSTSSTGESIPPYKIIVLDEADSMTPDAQSALRRTMETYSKVTRFCIICNYITRMITPITSRCAKFRFKPLSADTMLARLQFICTEEKVQASTDTLHEIMRQSEGDMRKAIQTLQSLHRLYMECITPQAVLDISGSVPPATVDRLVVTCKGGDFGRIQQEVEDLLAEGFPAGQLIGQLLDVTITDTTMTDMQKSKIACHLAEADKAFTDGANDFLQLMNVLAFISRQLQLSK